MKLNVFRFGLAAGIVWALCVFLTGLGNLFSSSYGVGFLKVIESLYPGYHFGQWGFGGVLVAAGYAVVDGLVVGLVFAWLYNLFFRGKTE
ncbi:hypothetical protein ACFLRM_02970 [Acidobacteriota bacterium]